MENALILFQNRYFCLLPAQNTRGFLLILHLKNLVEFLERKKTHESMGASPLIPDPRSFSFRS